MANNVIVFPKENKNYKRVISIDEIHQNMEMMNLYHIQETINIIAPLIFTQLEIGGFYVDDMEEDDAIREGAFMLEAIRAFLCKHNGIYHPFHRVRSEEHTSELQSH